MENRRHFLNTEIDNLTMRETIEKVEESIEKGEQIHHVVVNAGKIVALQKDKELRESVNQADLINADGQAVVWASKFLNRPLKERVAGIDLFTNLLALAHEKDYKVYLLGAKPAVLEAVVQKISTQYAPEIIAGYQHGYFSEAEEKQVVADIIKSNAHMLFVAITSPKKEIFINTHKSALSRVNFIMGVGGSFDVLAGKTKRAPKWMQNSGLEWLYRLIQEPKRMWKRYLVGNTKFIYLLLKEKFLNR